MLTTARTKGVRPNWIGEQTWVELLNYWDSQQFKNKSTQNKANRSQLVVEHCTLQVENHIQILQLS